MAPLTFYGYGRCDTCRKAKAWLASRGIELRERPIVEATPSSAELRALIDKSGLPARRWFNTSGQSYRALVAELGKAVVDALDEAEIVRRLAADGKLIKRPVLVAPQGVVVGFREASYEELLRPAAGGPTTGGR